MPLDVLGMTFDEVRGAVGAKTHEVKALRAEYREALAGRTDGHMWADLLPVVRCVEDGDLIKFIQRTHDGLETESVMVPMRRHGKEWKSLCISSQVGCARGCVFCETGQMGLIRNLAPSEIVGQVAVVRTHFDQKVRNIVFMGMGEPFDNFDNVMQAVRVLNDPAGLSISCERIAISTVGRIEGIRRLAAMGLRRLNLAISLNAPNDDIRSKIMPVNRLEPMGELREALLAYPLRKCQFFMIEYVLIPGVNDEREHAIELADYLRPLKCVVNVIPYNPRHESSWPAPDEQTIKQFIAWLKEQRQVVKRRLTKGRENMAACGQLGNRETMRRCAPSVTLPVSRADVVGGQACVGS